MNLMITKLTMVYLYSKRIWKLEETTEDWKNNNLEIIRKRLSGWQLDSFNESYDHKVNNGISLFKKNLKNE